METEEFEYGIQYYSEYRQEWVMATTNHFHGWYPTEKSAKNALAQLRAPSYGRPPVYEFRLVRRRVGAVEVVE